MNHSNVSLQLSEDEQLATVRMPGTSTPIVCGVLGVEQSADGRRMVYLRSRIHRETELEYSGWSLSGAITTIAEELPNAD